MDMQAEFRPSDSAELLLLAEEIGRIGIIDWDVRTAAVRLSPKALAMYGLERFDGRYDSWIATVYREDVIRLRNVIAGAFESAGARVRARFSHHLTKVIMKCVGF
jgi:PAS domain-containing protein